MTCEQCSDWLGDAVDGTLDAGRQAQLDAHCRGCASCSELLNDLKEIRAAAATLERHTPSPELWRAIAARVQAPAFAAAPAAGGRHGTSWAALATAAALVMMLGTAAWFGIATNWRGGGGGTATDLARSAASELQLAEQHYENAITALEQLMVGQENALDPSVAAEIAESLKSIDRAIDDSRTALKSDPGSFVAQTSLLEALRMKVALLQETVSLMNARS
jgi:predicted anti-sigma-YlaC factor YlaD